MKKAPVAQLKSRLSEYLKKVKAGEDIYITERGRPIAKIVPFAQPGADPDHLKEMEKNGLIRIGTGKLSRRFWDLPRPDDPGNEVLKISMLKNSATPPP